MALSARVLILAGLAMACRGDFARYCDERIPCRDPRYPHCDLDGVTAESGGHGRICVATPIPGADAAPPDGSVADGSVADGPVADGSVADGSVADGPGADGSVADGPAADGPSCAAWPLAPTGVDPCAVPAPTGALVLATGTFTYHTDTGALDGAAVAPSSALLTGPDPDVRVVSVDRLAVEALATLVVVGPYPVVFVVHGQAEILGAVDASALLDGVALPWSPGPGGEVACTVGSGPPGTSSALGAAGGGGGGFGRAGGTGGIGDAVAAVAGGLVEGVPGLSPLRGGCRGGRGGDGDAAAGGGDGGRGGGALQIAARDDLRVEGSIRANGGPGAGGQLSDAGGGGGGSGGAILLEAASVTVASAATICANGGGGGGGASDGVLYNPGIPGAPGTCSATTAAVGGTGGAGGGSAGGNGGHAATDAQGGLGFMEGGGGGGGAVGRIRIRALTTMIVGTVTPAPQ